MIYSSLVFKGGWVMLPIILGSIVALGIAIERGLKLYRHRIDATVFSEKIFLLIAGGKRDQAMSECAGASHSLAKVFAAGMRKWEEGPDASERAMEHEGNDHVSRLEKNMYLLLIIIGVEPMLGFLGTILGLIRAFMSWESAAQSVTVEKLAAGIYQAMITTAGGLIVAIPFFILYSVYSARINSIARELNHHGEELIEVMKNSPLRKRK